MAADSYFMEAWESKCAPPFQISAVDELDWQLGTTVHFEAFLDTDADYGVLGSLDSYGYHTPSSMTSNYCDELSCEKPQPQFGSLRDGSADRLFGDESPQRAYRKDPYFAACICGEDAAYTLHSTCGLCISDGLSLRDVNVETQGAKRKVNPFYIPSLTTQKLLNCRSMTRRASS